MKKKSGSASPSRTTLEVPRMTRAEIRRGTMGKYAGDAGASLRFVELERDVAEEFADAAEVNEALRLVKQLREVGGKKVKKKKSA